MYMLRCENKYGKLPIPVAALRSIDNDYWHMLSCALPSLITIPLFDNLSTTSVFKMVCKAAITLAVASYAPAAAAATIDKRITGGQDAELGEFPFIVSITGSNGHCGGTLLDSTTVLTAAHCIEGSSSVKAGSLVSLFPVGLATMTSGALVRLL